MDGIHDFQSTHKENHIHIHTHTDTYTHAYTHTHTDQLVAALLDDAWVIPSRRWTSQTWLAGCRYFLSTRPLPVNIPN